MKTKSLYISSLAPAAGSLVVAMGIMELLKGRLGKVAFFRPVVADDKTVDKDIEFMLEHYALGMDVHEMVGYSVHEVESLVAENKYNEVLETLIDKLKNLESRYDFVLIEGLNQSNFSPTIDFDINLSIAKNLSSPFISVLKGKGKNVKEVIDEIHIEAEAIKAAGCQHFATFVNRLGETEWEALKELTQKESLQEAPLYFLQEIPELDTPTVAEIKKTLGCVHIYGEEKDLRRVVKQSKIAAMKLDNFLEYIEDGDLIITSGDRSDIIVGCLSTVFSNNYPNISGILLTAGMMPHKSINKLIAGFKDLSIPILSVDEGTFTTAVNVANVPARITPQSVRKIALAMGLFSSNVNIEEMHRSINMPSSASSITPVMFEYALFERARRDRKRIVLPESNDERILRATEILLRRDVADIILLGVEEEVRQKSATLGLDISKATIIDPLNSSLMDSFVTSFYEMRKAKGLTLEVAKDSMMMKNYFGTMMVYLGHADGMVSGAIHTTQETIRPALQIIKTKPGISIVSSLFFMCLDTRVLVYGDCAVNQDPNAEELAQIAISSADTAKMFGIEPKIAMLSYSTGDSGKGEEVEKVRLATKIVKEARPDLLVEGPIQYDAAIDPIVAKTKLPNSHVAGQATIFIFPDLNTGNNTYKAVQRSSGAVAIGPVLQGLRKPVNDLSRGCLVPDIVNTVAITAIQAQSGEGEAQ
ncbi:MAG: phosphate acetyltransferase [Epsilonproteobacteria bacterium]|nr:MULTISPECIES: phosphate acetyltransferase [Sulfurospirillum]KHG34226.1 MAG: phosphate acetyltransferase [Sulfurospirillum sp. MES]MCP3651069.1 phosphate acetyltransferase [Sulfurospirillum sp. DNRA8]MCR1809915.1 phosphate acetyltransferase [Sulfurospirillum sp. DNRA8]NCB54901.1 phosphate acetyltransferase [Campylobacterota bacterium]